MAELRTPAPVSAWGVQLCASTEVHTVAVELAAPALFVPAATQGDPACVGGRTAEIVVDCEVLIAEIAGLVSRAQLHPVEVPVAPTLVAVEVPVGRVVGAVPRAPEVQATAQSAKHDAAIAPPTRRLLTGLNN